MSTHTIMQRDARSGSFEAAVKQTKGKRAELYAAIVERLAQRGPMIDEQLHREVTATLGKPATTSGVRSRRNELVLAGWVTELRDDDGAPVKRRGASGSPCQVWRLVEPGEVHEAPKPTRRPQGPALGDTETPEHAAGIAAARRLAAWHYGDAGLGEFIVNAYIDPATATAMLDEQGAPCE